MQTHTLPSTQALEQIEALSALTLPKLKILWKTLYRTPPPQRQKDFFVKQLTYRLQELTSCFYFDVDKQLDTLTQTCFNITGNRKRSYQSRLLVGSRLIRIYKGFEYQVSILENGFEYNGKVYKSLSHITKLITRQNRSGIAFFGLFNTQR